MASALDKLKKRSNNLEELQKKLESEEKKFKQDDDRMWYPVLDKAGNAMATIRFIPVFDPEDENASDWVKLYSHGFKSDKGLWYIENCPTTINEECPCCEMNVKDYKSGPDGEKIARSRKRKVSYYANVYIISDPSNPEVEGTVKIFRFGKKIFDILKTAIKPEFVDETPISPFSMWNDGANFKLKIRKVEGEINYDKSEFTKPVALFDSDEEIEAVWKKTYPLSEFISKDKFKTKEELKKRLDKVLGNNEEEFTSTKKKENVVSNSKIETDEEFDMSFDESINEEEMNFDQLEEQFQNLIED